MHRGIDYGVPLGSPLYAMEDGVVVEGSERQNVGGFGGWLWTRHQINGQVVETIIGHMYQRDIYVKKGDRVKRGQLVALSGNNGDSTGPHAHVEVWTAPGRVGGTAVDPAPWLKP